MHAIIVICVLLLPSVFSHDTSKQCFHALGMKTAGMDAWMVGRKDGYLRLGLGMLLGDLAEKSEA